MPAIVVCAACQTKLKVPENSTAKALKCPKCKGIVPLTPAKPDAKANPDAAPKTETPPPDPKPAPPSEEEELEVNEAADEQEEELEVNEAADEEEEEGDEEEDEDSPLVELGFTKGKDPFKVGQIPEPARKAIQKEFVKNEKALWAVGGQAFEGNDRQQGLAWDCRRLRLPGRRPRGLSHHGRHHGLR
jgi:hypothetical protein